MTTSNLTSYTKPTHRTYHSNDEPLPIPKTFKTTPQNFTTNTWFLTRTTPNPKVNNNINTKPIYKHLPKPNHMLHMELRAFEHKPLRHSPTHHHK